MKAIITVRQPCGGKIRAGIIQLCLVLLNFLMTSKKKKKNCTLINRSGSNGLRCTRHLTQKFSTGNTRQSFEQHQLKISAFSEDLAHHGDCD